MGRRNLLTTASSGSANGLQVISDRLADNFSILPGHHGTGDEGDGDDGGGGDNDGGIGDEDEGDEDEGDGGCVMMSKSFAMFECGNEGRAQPLSVRSGGGRARNPSAFLPLSISVCPPPPWRPRTHRGQTLILCGSSLMRGLNGIKAQQVDRTSVFLLVFFPIMTWIHVVNGKESFCQS